MHMLVGLLSVGAELVAIIACTVAINKLSEIKRAVTSPRLKPPQTHPPLISHAFWCGLPLWGHHLRMK